MKTKNWSIVLIIIAVIALAVGIISFTGMYHPTIEIENTKLQLFTFDHYESGRIFCQNDQTVDLDRTSYTLFDEEAFLADLQFGDQFFVRVAGDDLSDRDGQFSALAILGEKKSYLSLEDLNSKYKDLAVGAAFAFIAGLFVAIVLLIAALILILKRKN